MKKLIFTGLMLFSLVFAQAQEEKVEQISEGKFFIEFGTSFGEANLYSGSSINFYNDGDMSSYNVGLLGGYFIMDNFALTGSVGHGNIRTSETFSWGLGAKYYLLDRLPLSINLNGSSFDKPDPFLSGKARPLYLGFQAGYAFFIGDNVSIEPTLRYATGIREDAFGNKYNIFSFNVGFSFYF